MKKTKKINVKDVQIKKLERENYKLSNELNLAMAWIGGLVFIALASSFIIGGLSIESNDFDKNEWCLNKVSDFYPEYDIIDVTYLFDSCAVTTALSRRNGFVEASEMKMLSIINESELDMIHEFQKQNENKHTLIFFGIIFALIGIIWIMVEYSEYKSKKRGKK